MHPGKLVRLQKLWKHKRTVLIPFDHANYSGPVPGIEDTLRLTERIAQQRPMESSSHPGCSSMLPPWWAIWGSCSGSTGGSPKYTTEQRDFEEDLFHRGCRPPWG